jgi:hypothetical protein
VIEAYRALEVRNFQVNVANPDVGMHVIPFPRARSSGA